GVMSATVAPARTSSTTGACYGDEQQRARARAARPPSGQEREAKMTTSGRPAIDGGTPVRSQPLTTGKGLAVFGDEERKAALEVLESRSLFRYYGPALGRKVEAFE